MSSSDQLIYSNDQDIEVGTNLDNISNKSKIKISGTLLNRFLDDINSTSLTSEIIVSADNSKYIKYAYGVENDTDKNIRVRELLIKIRQRRSVNGFTPAKAWSRSYSGEQILDYENEYATDFNKDGLIGDGLTASLGANLYETASEKLSS